MIFLFPMLEHLRSRKLFADIPLKQFGKAGEEIVGFFHAEAERGQEPEHISAACSGEYVLLVDKPAAQLFLQVLQIRFRSLILVRALL